MGSRGRQKYALGKRLRLMGLPSRRMSSSCLLVCLCSSASQKVSLCMVSIMLFWREHTDRCAAPLPSGLAPSAHLPSAAGDTEAQKAGATNKEGGRGPTEDGERGHGVGGDRGRGEGSRSEHWVRWVRTRRGSVLKGRKGKE